MKVLYVVISLLFVINEVMCMRRHPIDMTQNYIKVFKNGDYHIIAARIKSKASNKFISLDVDSDVIVGNTTKVQAFRHKYALMQIHKIGQIVAFYNDLTSSYICYNEDGYLVKTKKEDLNELCIFIKVALTEHLYSYILYSERFGSSTRLQFDCDGTAFRAFDNLDLVSNETLSKCKNRSAEFFIYFTASDNY